MSYRFFLGLAALTGAATALAAPTGVLIAPTPAVRAELLAVMAEQDDAWDSRRC